MTPTGSIFYKDEFEVQYRVEWQTINNAIDMTSTTYTPYVWGQPAKGYIKNGLVFRQGIVTVTRQIIQTSNGGYEIVAEGSSQTVDYFQTNFPCGGGPQDTFKHHLDSSVLDDTHVKVAEGPHWADPDDSDDSDAIWGDVESDGSPDSNITLTGEADILEWIDVWS